VLAKKTIMKNVLLSFGLVVFIACAEGLYAADSDFRITDLRWTGTDQCEGVLVQAGAGNGARSWRVQDRRPESGGEPARERHIRLAPGLVIVQGEPYACLSWGDQIEAQGRKDRDTPSLRADRRRRSADSLSM